MTLLVSLQYSVFQVNVFVTVAASFQYRAVAENAADALAQVQAYVFDGVLLILNAKDPLTFVSWWNIFSCLNIFVDDL